MAEGTQPPPETVEARPVAQQPLKSHRGVLILVLGIIGLVLGLPGTFCCIIFNSIAAFVCSIIAWVMGSKDLKEMAAGRMDPAGTGLTKAGKICGIVGVILAIVSFVIQLIIIGLVIVTK